MKSIERPGSESPGRDTVTPEPTSPDDDHLDTRQLATPRPSPRASRNASLLAPLATLLFLGVMIAGLLWILFVPRELTVHGSVESWNGDSLAVMTLDGDLQRFVIDDDTERPLDLGEGDSIVVRYQRDEGGAPVATEIAPSEDVLEPSGGTVADDGGAVTQ